MAVVDVEVNDNVNGLYVDTSGDRLSGEPMVGAGTVPEGAYGIEAITYITCAHLLWRHFRL